MIIKFTTIAVMAIFYIAYFAKQIAQRRQGISTMILGKGDKPSTPRGVAGRDSPPQGKKINTI